MGRGARKEKTLEMEIDEAVEELMEQIDEHDLCQTDQPKSTTLELLKGLRENISLRIETIMQEIANEAEESEEEG